MNECQFMSRTYFADYFYYLIIDLLIFFYKPIFIFNNAVKDF